MFGPEPEPEPEARWRDRRELYDERRLAEAVPPGRRSPRRSRRAGFEEDTQLDLALERSRTTAAGEADRGLMDHAWAAPQSIDPGGIRPGFVGLEGLMEKLRGQIEVLEGWARRESWRSLDSAHFDWWTFPINEPSRHGSKTVMLSRLACCLSR